MRENVLANDASYCPKAEKLSFGQIGDHAQRGFFPLLSLDSPLCVGATSRSDAVGTQSLVLHVVVKAPLPLLVWPPPT